MIQDNETNFLYLADTLPKKYHDFYKGFEKVINHCKIPYKLLPQTNDVWAVDYMPIQIEKDKFLQFVYNPSYLQYSQEDRDSITDVDALCKSLNLVPKKSNILIDGGNVIRTKNKVIMTDRIFNENPTLKEKDLIKELENLFQVSTIIFIPSDPNDFTGHADGMVRFYDDNTVLINDYDYSQEDKGFLKRFYLSLDKAGLKYIKIPYNPYNNKHKDHANGVYINFLQMQQAIIIPTFKMHEDDMVVKQFEELFKGQRIETVDSNDIAYNSGILNCITWNIQVD